MYCILKTLYIVHCILYVWQHFVGPIYVTITRYMTFICYLHLCVKTQSCEWKNIGLFMFSSYQYWRTLMSMILCLTKYLYCERIDNHQITCLSFWGLFIVQQCVIVEGNSLLAKRLYICASVINISIINFPLLWQAYALLVIPKITKWLTNMRLGCQPSHMIYGDAYGWSRVT